MIVAGLVLAEVGWGRLWPEASAQPAIILYDRGVVLDDRRLAADTALEGLVVVRANDLSMRLITLDFCRRRPFLMYGSGGSAKISHCGLRQKLTSIRISDSAIYAEVLAKK